MMRAEDVVVTFNAGTAAEAHSLRGLNLAVPEGQFVAVIGSNGAGKSTLLGAIAGDVPVSRGRIFIGEEDATDRPAARRSSLVARVFQDPSAGTCAGLTLEENLAVSARRGQQRRLSRPALTAQSRRSFQDALAGLGLGLERRLDDLVGDLSGGQRQALGLLMATMRPARLLLLDEHTAALDPHMAELVMLLTERLVRERGLTALMVTHVPRHALEVGDRTVLLHEGRLAFDVAGTERTRLSVPELMRRFSDITGRGGMEAMEAAAVLS